jgi:NADH:ubiquinone oxidoreductase subunit 6 (subunit J)
MQKLEKTRARVEHDILMMQAQVEHYKRRVRPLRIFGTIFVVTLASLLLWMLPGFLADIGPNSPPLKDFTPVRTIFSIIFFTFWFGFLVIEIRMLDAKSYAKKLGGWIKEKQKRLEKMA